MAFFCYFSLSKTKTLPDAPFLTQLYLLPRRSTLPNMFPEEEFAASLWLDKSQGFLHFSFLKLCPDGRISNPFPYDHCHQRLPLIIVLSWTLRRDIGTPWDPQVTQPRSRGLTDSHCLVFSLPYEIEFWTMINVRDALKKNAGLFGNFSQHGGGGLPKSQNQKKCPYITLKSPKKIHFERSVPKRGGVRRLGKIPK